MQQRISKDQLWEKLGRLNPFLQQMVVLFIDSLLKMQTTASKRDKSKLLSVAVWSDEDIQLIEETQTRINAWQLPAF